MKHCFIGDVHGSDHWKIPVAGYSFKLNTGSEYSIHDFDKVVFTGDYVDAFTVDDDTMINNLLDIIQLKKDFPDKVVLLVGNHDVQYLFGYDKYGCSGYRPKIAPTLKIIFEENKKLFKCVYKYKNVLSSHAGIHDGWYRLRLTQFINKFPEDYDIDEIINELFWSQTDCIFDVGILRGGYHNVGGPLWLDAQNILKKPLKEFHQIVGHTPRREIKTYEFPKRDSKVTLIDTEYYGLVEPYFIIDL